MPSALADTPPEIQRLLSRLAADPRLTGFQMLLISAEGHVGAVHRYGVLSRRNLAALQQWLDSGPSPIPLVPSVASVPSDPNPS